MPSVYVLIAKDHRKERASDEPAEPAEEDAADSRYTERVIELGVVALVVGGLVAVPALFAVVPWDVTFGLGVALRRARHGHRRARRRALSPAAVSRASVRRARAGGCIRPGCTIGCRDGQRGGVMRWFRIGAVGFVIAIVGCVMVAVGALRS